MTHRLLSVVSLSVLLTATTLACGSDGGATFPDDEDPKGNASSGDGGGPLTGSSSGTSGGNGPVGGDNNNLPPELQSCGSESRGGKLLPAELTIVFDKSGSMCWTGAAHDCASPQARWPATATALRGFLTSQDSTGVTAAVRSYGPVDRDRNHSVATNRCEAAKYNQPDFPAAALPSAALADAVLAALPLLPANGGDPTMTQTGAALGGAAEYMQARKAALNGEKSVSLLLISDGDPSGCGTNPTGFSTGDLELAKTAAAAAAAADIKVHVLNIGGTVEYLNQIAQAGGTGAAITIDDPTDSNKITAALAQVRGQTLSCSFAIPDGEDGTRPDVSKLNVAWTPVPNGASEALVLSDDCSNARGWHYDVAPGGAVPPSKIELCPAACQEVLGTIEGQIDVVLGCETVTVH